MKSTPNTLQFSAPWAWDVFCHVIDNFGDAGVAWRLCVQLAQRGHSVRLWMDDPSPLAWMAPQGHPGVRVIPWDPHRWNHSVEPAQVVIETFGCTLPQPYVRRMGERVDQGAVPPVWINLEYLSAEDYVERSHRLPSPQRTPQGRVWSKWFFYPGWTDRTGGLLRETGLEIRRSGFDRDAWLAELGVKRRPAERVVSLFCYQSAPVSDLLKMLQGTPTLIMTTPGPASLLTQGWPTEATDVRIHALPWLSQIDYDQVLWSADFNIVRGEDSLVRAVWARAPFVWQIYPQHDGVHERKLQAFLSEMLQAFSAPQARAVRQFMRWWNRLETPLPMPPEWVQWADWRRDLQPWTDALCAQPDLVTQLTTFVQERFHPAELDENP